MKITIKSNIYRRSAEDSINVRVSSVVVGYTRVLGVTK